MPSRSSYLAGLVLAWTVAGSLGAGEADDSAIERGFQQHVEPFLKSYCLDCHGPTRTEGKLDLSGASSVAAILKHQPLWETVLERVEAEEMPPEKARRQPADQERRAVVEWIGALRDSEARRHAGDPGPVLARRLSNAEYDYSIRDLTGVDIRPTREFPVDPANEAGFDNSGESLTMSPALVKKYLAAARLVADHVVLKPSGFVFAPHPAVTDTDRDKYCVHRIIDFYKRHEVDLADYFEAAWRYRHRAETGQAHATLADVAAQAHLSPKYLATVWETLNEPAGLPGPLAQTQEFWSKLPEATAARDEVRQQCAALRDRVRTLRKPYEVNIDKLHARGISDGSQSFLLWRARAQAASRMRGTDDRPDVARFCATFPSLFVMSDRGLHSDPAAAGTGRLLTAGFHLMQGYFRDDQPLCELVLDAGQNRELDGLWDELNFITLVPMRQYKDFIFFERAEPPRYMQEADFDFARSEDKDAISRAKREQLARVYLEKARRMETGDQALAAIERYFAEISASIEWVEQKRLAAEPSHLAALLQFAQRAYRRPLAPAERDELLSWYRLVREQEGLSHEDALRDTLAGVLMSPWFSYRFDLASADDGIRPLADDELASRLSYFLWSSLPDDELLAHAAKGDLHQPDVLIAQTRRMLRDDRIGRLATEFAGNWLDFRRFEEHNAVDRERFAGFTSELRQAMYEEPLRFFVDVAQHDRSLLEFVAGRHTFVNPLLAAHYGIPAPGLPPGEWQRVERADEFGRGGYLPMSVFLTKNSPGLRTSPVKRGYWVVRRLLGEHIPAPPPDVPELPKDEAGLGELTLPQVLARHREHKSCAGCHDKFDSIGLAFEGYGPVGERRDKDLGGRPIADGALFPDGSRRTGLEGLRQYLTEKRQTDFVENFSRKLMTYALGRSLLLSDRPALDEIKQRLADENYRFGALVESIVTSRQFLNKRGNEVAGGP